MLGPAALGLTQALGEAALTRTATVGTSSTSDENSRDPSTSRRMLVSAVTVADLGP
jgi:hypothetical protein